MQDFKSTTVLVLLAVGTLAASSFLFMKVLVDQISPSEIVLGRVLFGALALLIVIRLRTHPLELSTGLVVRLLPFAALETVLPFTLIASAEQKIDSGLAAVMISSMPLFTVVFATLTPTGERLTSAGLSGLAMGFLGIVVLSGIGTDVLVSGDTLARLAVVGGAASYAAAGVYARLMLTTEDAVSISGLQLGLATLMAVPLVFLANGAPSFDLSIGGWGALLTLGVAGSGAMLLGFLWLVEKVGSIGASLVTYVVPFAGVFLGWAALGESIGERTVLGLLLILAGVAVTMRGGTNVAQADASIEHGAATPALFSDARSSA
jgi:drug/metabolite transporter (DMT)-like permease